MTFWKKTKKIFSNLKRQGSDRIKIPSTQEICRSQSDYAIDSLKLYEKQLEQLKKKNGEDNPNGTMKQRPLSLFIERNGDFDDETESGNSTVGRGSEDSMSDSSSNSSTGNSQDMTKGSYSDSRQLHSRGSSKIKWTDFSVSDLHNFLVILQKEEDATKTAIINRYKYLSKQISLRLKLMKT